MVVWHQVLPRDKRRRKGGWGFTPNHQCTPFTEIFAGGFVENSHRLEITNESIIASLALTFAPLTKWISNKTKYNEIHCSKQQLKINTKLSILDYMHDLKVRHEIPKDSPASNLSLESSRGRGVIRTLSKG